MKVNSNRDISFKGLYTNKALKKGFEFAADNVAFFSASTVLAFSLGVRPCSIYFAPKADKENKKIACAKSIASSFSQFILTYLVSTPIVKGIQKINENPQKFLKPETIKTFQGSSKKLIESKSYEFATQMFKLAAGASVAIPKALLTAACMPFVLDKVFHQKHKGSNEKNLSFKGKGVEKIASTLGKTLDKKGVQKFSNKYADTNFVMHAIAATDICTTSVFINQIYNSNKIEENRKKALIYNTGFSTILGIGSGYAADKVLDKPAEKFIKIFKEKNKSDPNLEKQVRGIKIAKPIIVLGGIYYMFIPFISTLLAEAADKNKHFDFNRKCK